MIASLTADGFLARHPDDFAMDWTSPEDSKGFVELTKRAGVVVMGARTFKTLLKAGRKMPGRKMIIYSNDKNICPPGYRSDPTEVIRESPADLIKRIASEGYQQLAVCGGMMVYSLFMKAGVVDELYITIEPKLFGDGLKFLAEAQEVDLEVIDTQMLNPNTIRLHYKVKR